MGFLFKAVTYVSGFIALLTVAVCLAAGLYLASEVAEENATLMRKLIRYSIFGITIMQLLLCLDGIPAKHTFGSIACVLTNLLLLTDFPFVEPVSFPVLASLLGVIGNHMIWFNYFAENQVFVKVRDLLGFFLVFVWAVPLAFFVSLTLADEMLPSATYSAGRSGNTNINGAFGGQKKRNTSSFFKNMINGLISKKDEMFPASRKQRY